MNVIEANEGCCQEAMPGYRGFYEPCNKPAEKQVYLHGCDRIFDMCKECAATAVSKRGAKYVGREVTK